MKGDEMGGNVTYFGEEVIQSYYEKILREDISLKTTYR
jgi:hypothetical protein